MKVTLAGFTTDVASFIFGDAHPETIPAAYARISRRPEPLRVLRCEARQALDQASRSCANIVHGMGHQSIAEHAVLQFDIEGISRLLVEDLEHHRLASFTERSYRYCPAKASDYYTPPQIEAASSEEQDRYHNFIAGLFHHYQELTDAGIAFLRENKFAGTEQQLAQKAQEDARIILPLALTTSVGMTINARSLSRMIKRLRAVGYDEARQLAAELETQAKPVAPALIRHTEVAPVEKMFLDWNLTPVADLSKTHYKNTLRPFVDIELVRFSEFEKVLESIFKLSLTGFSLVDAYVKALTQHDAMPRVFELSDVVVQCIGSATFFAQLKRHRMASIFTGGYDTRLGHYIPLNMRRSPVYEKYLVALQFVQDTEYGFPFNSAYSKLGATRRRILFKMNCRSLVHFFRLRRDSHAAEEIRQFADALAERLINTPIQSEYGKTNPAHVGIYRSFLEVLFAAKHDFENKKRDFLLMITEKTRRD